MLLRPLLFSLLLPAAALSAQQPIDTTGARPITLDEAIRLAHRNAPQAVQARGQARISRVSVRSAYASFLPSTNVNLTSNWSQGQRIGPTGNLIDFTGPRTSYSDGLSLNMELFDGGRRFHQVRSSRAQLNSADETELLQRFSVSLAVKQRYFEILAAIEAGAAAQVQLEQAQQQLAAASARVAAGAAIRSDSLRSMVLVGNARLALLDAQTSLEVANAGLTRLVGTTYTVTAAGDQELDPSLPEFTQAQLLEFAEDGPAVRQARAQLVAANAAVRVAKTGYLPTISANYSRGGSGFDARFGWGSTFAYTSNLRVTLSLPIFDRLDRELGLVRTQVAEENAEATLRDARLLAQQELAQGWGQLRSAQQRIIIQTATVAATEEDLYIQQQRYALGAATLLDVLTSQTQMNQAQAGLIQARRDFRMAQAQLEALIGRDLY
jgi:outer membrane protein